MTNRKLVLLMYSDAVCHDEPADDPREDRYFVYSESAAFSLYLGSSRTRIEAWKEAADFVNKRAINMLAS
jgi:hypothetical protein